MYEMVNKIRPKLSLQDWKKSMSDVVKRPNPNHYYFCNDNIYLRYEINGRGKWHRLSAKEIIELFTSNRFDVDNYNEFYKKIHKSCSNINIDLIDH